MADRPLHPATGDDTGVGPDRQATAGMPRWVKVSGIIAITVIVLVVFLLLTGGGPGGHDPGRHTQSGEPGGGTSLSSVTADTAQSEDGHG